MYKIDLDIIETVGYEKKSIPSINYCVIEVACYESGERQIEIHVLSTQTLANRLVLDLSKEYLEMGIKVYFKLLKYKRRSRTHSHPSNIVRSLVLSSSESDSFLTK